VNPTRRSHPGRLPAALAALLALATGCRGCARANGAEVLGAARPLDGVDLAPYFAVARAIVTGGARPAANPPPAPGDRVFLTAWGPGGTVFRATGLGATLLESVVLASEQLVGMAPPQPVRLEIDVLTAAEPASLDLKMHESVFEVGLHGYLAAEGAAQVGWILPSEILDGRDVDLAEHNKTLKLHGDKLIAAIAARAGVDVSQLRRMSVSRFRIAERIEPTTKAEPPLALFRRMPAHPGALSADALLAAVRAGGDYLARMTDAQGMFTYLYDPVADQKLKGYGLLRHAGSIYALMEAYEELRVPEWLAKARLALDYMKTRIKPTPEGSYLLDNTGEEQQKVGGSGLALIALAKYAEATGDLGDLQTMRELARLILHQQYPDGHFRDNADLMREDESLQGKKLAKEVPYFPGEAALGLVRLYALDPQPSFLAGARGGVDFLIHVRDAHDDLKTQNHDHWQSYALHDLYVLTGDKAYLDQAEKIAHAILLGEKTPDTAAHPDYVGTFYDEGETTPTSTRLEALASTMQLSRFAGVDESWMAPAAMQLACFMRGQQLDAESVFFVKDPAKAIGGVRESLDNSDVRIDYVQHAMSAWLRLARLLRDPNYGKAAHSAR
jgi:hypothetical protein